jgi:predicted 3-demethylubiquinone-9 3-methyltransferase (glyoxalase superfamily)
MQKIAQKILPFLWFDTQAEEAAKFYISVFKNSSIGKIGRGPNNSVMTISFNLDGQEFVGLNGGPMFKFTEAVSFVVNCADQGEIDFFWEKLSEGGEKSRCGWLKDKFGLSWQVVPAQLGQLIGGSDAAKAQRAMAALMKMDKLDIKILEEA